MNISSFCSQATMLELLRGKVTGVLRHRGKNIFPLVNSAFF